MDVFWKASEREGIELELNSQRIVVTCCWFPAIFKGKRKNKARIKWVQTTVSYPITEVDFRSVLRSTQTTYPMKLDFHQRVYYQFEGLWLPALVEFTTESGVTISVFHSSGIVTVGDIPLQSLRPLTVRPVVPLNFVGARH